MKKYVALVALFALAFVNYANAITIVPHENDKTFLRVTCDNVTVNGNTWTLSGTWTAYNFGGQATQYDTAIFSPSGNPVDTSSKDAPDAFVTVNGPSDYADDATPPHKDDMDGTWSNQVVFNTTPSTIFATLYHSQVPGNESSGDAQCQFVLPPRLTLQKTVVNDDEGAAVDTDWTLSASGPSNISGTEGSAAVTNAVVLAGVYTLSESGGPDGYTASLYSCVKNGGQSVLSNSLTLADGDVATCTITNNDEDQENTLPLCSDEVDNDGDDLVDLDDPDCADFIPTLTVTKFVTNDNGGEAEVSDFPLFIDGNPVTSGVSTQVTPGAHVVTETESDTYTASFGLSCPGGNISVAIGENKSCTITNDDKAATLTVIKHVVNDNGGLKEALDFLMSVLGGNVSNSSFVGSEDGTVVTLDAGEYDVDEIEQTGYAKTLGADCSGTIAAGEEKTCTVTNDDVAPKLTVTKVVINQNGGGAEISDFTLFIDDTEVSSGAENELDAGTYTVSEESVDGYAGVFSGDCNAEGEVTLNPGDDKECVITNTDIAPGLTLLKVVTNNNGGEADAEDFQAYVQGGESEPEAVDWNDTLELEAGTYALSEIPNEGITGYEASDWVCDGGSQDGSSITLEVGEEVVCTITNDDIAPVLHLVKEVVNDNGGNATADQWTLSATGPTPISGEGTADSDENFSAGVYTLAETSGPSGYTAGDWVCVGGSQEGDSISLSVGDEVTCTITNDDDQGTLIVNKIVAGGEASADDFSFSVNGGGSINFEADGGNSVSVDAGFYTVVENSNELSYLASYENCSEVEVGNGGTATCTVTNTFSPVVFACSDQSDNDEDSLVDMADPGCHSDGNVNNSDSYVPTDNDESNSSNQCSDGVDNADSEDTLVDSADPGCHSDGNVQNPESWNPEDNDETDVVDVCPNIEGLQTQVPEGKHLDNNGNCVDNTSGGGGGGGGNSSGSRPRSQGEVLGAATEICNWGTQYLRRSWNGNVPNDVQTMQNFLNLEMNSSLVVDSIFGPKTEAAVKSFQLKYLADILAPWGISQPTGIWYISTTTKAKEIMCGEKTALPPLINWSQNPAVR